MSDGAVELRTLGRHNLDRGMGSLGKHMMWGPENAESQVAHGGFRARDHRERRGGKRSAVGNARTEAGLGRGICGGKLHYLREMADFTFR